MCEYISIGVHCTCAMFLKNNNLRNASYPFDWMISNPKFVFEILELLLDKNINVDEIVSHYFF